MSTLLELAELALTPEESFCWLNRPKIILAVLQDSFV